MPKPKSKDSANGVNNNNGSRGIDGWEVVDPEDEYVGPRGVSRHLNMAIQNLKYIIKSAKENYDKTGNLEALQIAFEGNVALADMVKQIDGFYGRSYGNFDLTE